MKLTSYGVESFRPFSKPVVLERLGRVNIIAGANNIGKSSLLMPLRRLTLADQRYRAPRSGPLKWGNGDWLDFFDERDRRSPDSEPTFQFGLELDADDLKAYGPGALGNHGPSATLFVRFFRPESRTLGFAWNTPPLDSAVSEAQSRAKELAARIVYVPPARVISRRIETTEPHEQGERLFDGETFYGDLLQMQLEGGERLAAFDELASEILGQSIEVRATARPAAVSVKVGEDPARALEDLGQGLLHVLVTAAATTFAPKPILLLEEPEQGLHPLVQRRLVESLAQLPDATTFITSHSNHILDADHRDVRRFHLAREPDGTRVVHCLDDTDTDLLRDLGVRPSSILAANALIWVEGPSDEVYIRTWLKAFGGDHLREHMDFEFLRYGGALLSHIDPGDGTRRGINAIHPNWFLVADRDSSSQATEVGNSRMRALESRININRRWTTAERTIESYLTDDELRLALELPRAMRESSRDDETLEERMKRLGSRRAKVDKVGLARKVVERVTNWPDRLGLRGEVEKLVRFIEAASHGTISNRAD